MPKRVDALYSGATELQSRIRPAVRVITNRLWRFDLQGFEQLFSSFKRHEIFPLWERASI